MNVHDLFVRRCRRAKYKNLNVFFYRTNKLDIYSDEEVFFSDKLAISWTNTLFVWTNMDLFGRIQKFFPGPVGGCNARTNCFQYSHIIPIA